MNTILDFQQVRKTFNKKGKAIHALRGLSFQVAEGEVFGFVGPNGAGKSTAIKVMLDVIRDYEGEVRIFGHSARQAEARRGVAYLPESPALYEQFTPLEILQTALRMYGIQRKDEQDWCMQWLERFSVAHNAKRKIRQLSKGNVQRVALAHAMVVSPRLLVLDEPLSGLDPVGRKDVIDILQEYKNGGGAIFFTSHVLHDVERIADRFGFINNGELFTTRSPHELATEHADKFIVRYHAAHNTKLEGVALRENEFRHELNQAALPHWLEQLNRENGQIIDIKPAVSLESVFFKILEESRQTSQGAKTSDPAK
jgi:ABC-2 type transport system ATP-binding protein